MTLTKIAIAGCFVLSAMNFAAADEVRIDTGNHDAVVHSNDAHRHAEIRHDDDWYRRHHHHHEDHHDDHLDINIGH